VVARVRRIPSVALAISILAVASRALADGSWSSVSTASVIDHRCILNGNESRHSRRPHGAAESHFNSQRQTAGTSIAADQQLIVRVDRDVPVPDDFVQLAEDRAAEIFSRIGVRVRWIDVNAAVREHLSAPFTLVLVNAYRNPGLSARLEESLGLAEPQVGRAHIFYDRIDALRARTNLNVPALLGDVMAHELGHLMLPPPGHSSNGIMRPNIASKVKALETFTSVQAQEILNRIRQTQSLPVFQGPEP